MNGTINKLMKDISKLYEEQYKRLLPVVNNIIENNDKNISTIEHVLDELLSCSDVKCSKLFLKLCEYYFTINKENASIYMKLFLDYNDNDLSNFTKKKR